MRLFFVKGIGDSAHAIFNADTGKYLGALDAYHGERIPDTILELIGIKYTTEYHDKFIPDEEFEGSGCTDEPDNLDLLKKRVKKYIKAKPIVE